MAGTAGTHRSCSRQKTRGLRCPPRPQHQLLPSLVNPENHHLTRDPQLLLLAHRFQTAARCLIIFVDELIDRLIIAGVVVFAAILQRHLTVRRSPLRQWLPAAGRTWRGVWHEVPPDLVHRLVAELVGQCQRQASPAAAAPPRGPPTRTAVQMRYWSMFSPFCLALLRCPDAPQQLVHVHGPKVLAELPNAGHPSERALEFVELHTCRRPPRPSTSRDATTRYLTSPDRLPALLSSFTPPATWTRATSRRCTA